MVTRTRPAARLTPKGLRTRARIVEAAAELIHQRGVASATLEDVKAAAQVSGSQLYHYFADKEALVQAVIDRQAAAIVDTTERADLRTPAGMRAWCNMILTEAERVDGQGGCPLGSLGGQLAESDILARARVAAGFDRWSSVIADGLRALRAAGHLTPQTNPDDLAVMLLATLQGGLLIAQVHRDIRPLKTALDTLLGLLLSQDSPVSRVCGR